MANHYRQASATAIAQCNTVVDLLDAGSSAGSFIIYTGTEPAFANDAAGTEVATCVCSDPAYADAVADAVNNWADANLASTATDSSATGHANAVTYFRAVDSDGAVVWQGTAGTSGTDLVLNSAVIGAGAQVDLTQMEFRVPYNAA